MTIIFFSVAGVANAENRGKKDKTVCLSVRVL